jgi:hypothetical protein
VGIFLKKVPMLAFARFYMHPENALNDSVVAQSADGTRNFNPKAHEIRSVGD